MQRKKVAATFYSESFLFQSRAAFAVRNSLVVADPAQGFPKLLCCHVNELLLHRRSPIPGKKIRCQAIKIGSAFKINSESLHMAELIILNSSYTKNVALCSCRLNSLVQVKNCSAGSGERLKSEILNISEVLKY